MLIETKRNVFIEHCTLLSFGFLNMLSKPAVIEACGHKLRGKDTMVK
jgi:hypothetical protein